MKVADLTTCYAKSIASDKDSNLYQSDIEKFLKEHVTNKAGARVSYGISKYIPPNQCPDNYEGIDTLFNEQWMPCRNEKNWHDEVAVLRLSTNLIAIIIVGIL